MKFKRPWPNVAGMVCIALGVLIILSLVLPSGFWWLLLGIALISLGIFWLRRC